MSERGVLLCEAAARFPMLLEVASGLAPPSSPSSGVGSGGRNWMLLRSGSDPPELWVAGIRELERSWSGEGNILEQRRGWSPY